MTVEDVKELIENNKSDIAFIIGNGINLHKPNPGNASWEDLLKQLWKNVDEQYSLKEIPKGLTFTEFYDMVVLNSGKSDKQIQDLIVEKMRDMTPSANHYHIVKAIKNLNAPILTTNYDKNLSAEFNLQKQISHHVSPRRFTAYYPWERYFSDKILPMPTSGFGIWHINGLVDYKQSIRIGLSHYMGIIERARNLIQEGLGDDNLFKGKNVDYWKGSNTWLHIIFNKSLFVFGLSLNENEIFLRWLLITRKKYFDRFPERQKRAWYLKIKSEAISDGKKLFLNTVGFEILEVDSYEDIYENIWN